MVKFDNAKTRPYQNKRVPGKMQTHFFKLAKRKNYDIIVNTKRKNTTRHPFVPPPQKKHQTPQKAKTRFKGKT